MRVSHTGDGVSGRENHSTPDNGDVPLMGGKGDRMVLYRLMSKKEFSCLMAGETVSFSSQEKRFDDKVVGGFCFLPRRIGFRSHTGKKTQLQPALRSIPLGRMLNFGPSDVLVKFQTKEVLQKGKLLTADPDDEFVPLNLTVFTTDAYSLEEFKILAYQEGSSSQWNGREALIEELS